MIRPKSVILNFLALCVLLYLKLALHMPAKINKYKLFKAVSKSTIPNLKVEGNFNFNSKYVRKIICGTIGDLTTAMQKMKVVSNCQNNFRSDLESKLLK